MAKNYTFSEAVNIIAEGKDLESITDIGRRYPVLATKVAVVAAKAGEAFTDLMSFMPDYLTANKVNTAIKNSITGSDASDDEDAGDENEAVEDAGEDVETTAKWDESMSAKQLWDLLGKAGKRKVAKSTKKADLIEACKKVFGDAGENADDVEDEDTTEDTVVNPYEGKTAMELFKECKARKIKAAPKKPAKFYVDLLLKDDEAKAAATEDEADDDWGDEEEAEAPKKEEKKASKGGKSKAAKKVEAESDDDDDWDI